MAHQKQYGLILPDKGKSTAKAPQSKSSSSKAKNVFGDDSSDEESNVDWVRQSLKKQSHGSMQQKASMKVMKEALQDDPSVYEYDEVYDDMAKKKEDSIAKRKGDKKPKYIEGLLKTAKQRELENELRKEREAQREREKEGDEFADKEAFVTSSFKKKMEELRKMEEDQAYTDAIDDVTDVTKQRDMSGFYRQLYRDTMKTEDEKDATKQAEKGPDKTKDAEAEAKGSDQERPSVKEKDEDRKGNSERDRRSERSDRDQHEDRKRSDRDKHEDRKQSDRERISDRDKDAHRKGNDRDCDRKPDRDYDRKSDRHYDRERKSDRDYDRDRRDHRNNERDRDHREIRHDREKPDRDHRRSDRESDKGKTRSHRDNDNRTKTDNRDNTRDGDRIKDKDKEKSGPIRGDSLEDIDSKVKIIPNENWYDFDVQIERDVKKSFYAKRTVGTVFDEALQRYLERKSVSQVVIYK